MGDTRRVADGEESIPLRPLRPATPRAGSDVVPDGPTSRLPRPRRPWLRSTEPASGAPVAASGDAGPKAADARPPAEPAAAPGESESDDPQTTVDPDSTEVEASSTSKAEEKPTAKAEEQPTVKAEEQPTDKADSKQTGNAEGEPVSEAESKQTGKAEGEPAASAPDPAPSGARRRRTRFAHAVRLPGPRTAARATRDWSRRPSGRLTLPGVFLLALVAATATVGAMLVPATIGASRPVAAGESGAAGDRPPSDEAPGVFPPPDATLPPGMAPPTAPGTAAPTGAVPIGGRPSDALAGWAREVGARAGIDPIAMQAYGYAELVLAETNRSCGLSWTTLAAIGFVESRHGQANNARLGPDGRAIPEIIGLPLDGQGGRMRIADTDRGELDGDTTYDRAIGPMQFIPTTWQEIGADADNDGRKDPHNIHDAALAAGAYLCKGNRNLTIPGDWWNAILSYNNVRPYAQDVFNTANRYGQASRT
ncbi:lytic murein transglycosylase [Micromonospora sp. NPDC051196]|uniref:lytic murein transglycosylase n=1 Tax=Micromonospora sp. NPDC051196 TaxID=3155281 RepID=UPI003435730F